MVISHQSVQLPPCKFRKFFRMWGSGIHCMDQRTLSLALCAPRNWLGVCVWIKADDGLQDAEEKPLCWLFPSIAMSQQHMTLSFKVTSAGEDNEESWAEHENTLSANSLPLSWIVCGSSGRIMTFYLLSMESGFCFENIFFLQKCHSQLKSVL